MEGEKNEEINGGAYPTDFSIGRGSFDVAPDRGSHGLSGWHKTAGILIVLAGISGLIFGSWQLLFNIKNPFLSLLQGAATEECPGGDCEQAKQLAALSALQAKDTDGDGLSDYNELYIYKTSAYLEDTDGDGISDKEEADKGWDPNCPGQGPCAIVGGSGNATGTVPTLQTIVSGQQQTITPAMVRQMLLSSGISADELSGVTDEQLMALYQEAIADKSQTVAGPTASAPATTASTTIDLSQINISSANDLKNLTGAQIRAMLIQAGASASLLAQVSDDELKQMFIQKLNEKSTTNP